MTYSDKQDLIDAMRRVIVAARKDLGHDLEGYSIRDLLLDQFDDLPEFFIDQMIEEGKLS